MLLWSGSGESSLPGVQTASFSLYPSMALSLCSPAQKATSPPGLEFYLMTAFNLNYLLNPLSPSIVTFGGGLQCMKFEGTQSSSWHKENQENDMLIYTYHYTFNFGRSWFRILISVRRN